MCLLTLTKMISYAIYNVNRPSLNKEILHYTLTIPLQHTGIGDALLFFITDVSWICNHFKFDSIKAEQC